VRASQTGARGGANSSWARRGRATLAAWCGGGSRRASSSRAAAVGIGVRTCSRWRVLLISRPGDSRGRCAGRCLFTVGCANRACLVARGREVCGQQRRERKGRSGSVCCTFGVYGAGMLGGARRIQSERIPCRGGRQTSGCLVMVVVVECTREASAWAAPAFERSALGRGHARILGHAVQH
jgi:hypothetical protein